MTNYLLLTELNKLLGTGKSTARNNYAYSCPLCHHTKPKFEINLDEESLNYQNYNCWVCGIKGKSLNSLFKKLKLPDTKIQSFLPYLKFKINKHNKIVKKEEIQLPLEFNTFFDSNTIIGNRALNYLLKRNITKEDIIKHNIGYCYEGTYKNRIIIPSYNSEGNLNYFIARSIEENAFKKYLMPQFSKNITIFEYFINWNLPIVLCEGVFDALAIKRNAIPLLGKFMSQDLLKKLIQCPEIYVALDKDALKQSINICEQLLNLDKKVHLIKLDKKDPSELGFVNFTKLQIESKPLTFSNLLEEKFKL